MTNKEAVSVADELILQAVARGWCAPENAHKEMDAVLAQAIAREVSAALRSAAPNADDKPVAWVTPRTMKALRRRDRQGVSTATMGRRTEKKTEPLYAARPSPPDDAVLRVDAKRWQAFCGMLDANEVQAVFLQMHFRHGGGQEQILYSNRLTEVVDAALASSTKKETPRG